MTRFLIAIALLLSSFISEQVNATEQFPMGLVGRWKLVNVDCVDHKLGKLGLDSRQSLNTEKFEALLDISKSSLITDWIERPNPTAASAYCKETDEADLNVSADIMIVTNERLRIREGHGGFKCYSPYHYPTKVGGYKSKYKIEGKTLSIAHKELSILQPNGKLEHECETGADLVQKYERL